MHRSARVTAIAVPLAAVIARTGCSTDSGTKPASSVLDNAAGKAAWVETPADVVAGDWS